MPWVLWRAEPRGEDKPAKVPYRVMDPEVRASSTNPETWGSFEQAVAAYRGLAGVAPHPLRGPVAGIGVVLTAAERPERIACIDLDRVIDPAGGLDARAARIVTRCHSWTEYSPSGTGLHIFVLGTVAQAIKGEQIEVYSDRRYIAVTGRRWPGTADDLSPQQEYLDHLLQLDQAAAAPRRPWTGPSVPPPDDLIGALLARLQGWGLRATRVKRWSDGYLVELAACPWASEHSSGPGGAAVMIHASGAFDFTCLHQHCAQRSWRDLRGVMERPA